MSYGFQPPPPYQPGAPPYQPGAPPQPGFPGAPPPYQGGQCAVIRNTPSGLCLDATEYEVKLQHYTGSPAQQWILEPVGGGDRYVLRNKGNGAVLDIEGGPDCGANLITYESHGGLNQQWFVNPDHTITSAAANLAVDVCDGNCFPGNILIAYDRHGGPNQQFHLEYH
ncbi:uncharacterized protein LOC664464 [Tribolium castaneum]|uniref:Ricin B lectin domain-containing protein n=1 Tax=Tribolium castaneum TaxID=7070 RepID=D6WRB2_TRICA|nr:PREDICTED: uncharacterized protein LOC664464 [Tribolium castaneum]XP_976485.1 PREDICTED: uncharacterized protein LOC664464 [Tribolium castaneum]EFA05981.1 hypothetical protein TcasGA2_TC008807 [Tribolium castaneum]|eukprot:XP_008195967.1 PREDICTED: uncharacterized protein LOC664464 [Tribolium castaneum]